MTRSSLSRSSVLACIMLYAVNTAISQTDTLCFIDGHVRPGTIVGATDLSVVLESGNERATFQKSAVTTLIFARSDRLITSKGDTLACKIASHRENWLTVVGPQGTRVLAETDCQSVLYNAGEPLKTAVLPPTDRAFHPSPQSTPPASGFTLYVRLGYGFHNGSLEAWSRTWRGADTHTSGRIMTVEAGMNLGPAVSWGLGYEHFKTATTSGEVHYAEWLHPALLRGSVGYDLFYGTFRLRTLAWRRFPLWVYGAADAGVITIAGNLTNLTWFPDRPDEASNTSIALRLKGGFLVSFNAHLHLSLEGEFLAAGESNGPAGRELNVSGLGAALGLEYYILTQ